MENNQKQYKLKTFTTYLPKVVKFYDLKNEWFTRIVFMAILATFIVSWLMCFPYIQNKSYVNNPVETKSLLIILLLTIFVVDLISSVYLAVYISELRGKKHTLKSYLRLFVKKVFAIVLGTAVLSFSLSLIPFVFLIYVIIMFCVCYTLDMRLSFTEALEASRNITRGYRMHLLINLFLFVSLFYFPLGFIAVFSGKWIVIIFLQSFGETVLSLMYKRLMALMYVDLEYGPMK